MPSQVPINALYLKGGQLLAFKFYLDKLNMLRGGGGGPRQIFLDDQIWALGTTGAPNNKGNYLWSYGTSAPNRLRATPRPKIGRKIVISPRWS